MCSVVLSYIDLHLLSLYVFRSRPTTMAESSDFEAREREREGVGISIPGSIHTGHIGEIAIFNADCSRLPGHKSLQNEIPQNLFINFRFENDL